MFSPHIIQYNHLSNIIFLYYNLIRNHIIV
nr:MAG TPA: hypothetical protein [Caudoviricetes sp.]